MRLSLSPARPALALLAVTLALLPAVPALAQDEPPASGPAFTLSSSQVYSTRERPAFRLTFRRLDHLDFRVYRVNDPVKFFAGLRDPHVLGSPEPVVPEEQTWLERIAAWKATRRAGIRRFVRAQFSWDYREARRARTETDQVALRRTVNYRNFAQVPVLNASQVVASWREILPPVAEAEARRIPLDVKGQGVYLVEAVAAPLKAYTIVIVSDIGLVTKAAPGQLVVFAADRFTGEPIPGCEVQAIVDQQLAGAATTATDGTGELRLQGGADDVVTVARCGGNVTVGDPGSWNLRDALRELVGYVYTDKPIYRPGHTVRIKAVLRWRTRGLLARFDRPEVEVRVADVNDKTVYRERRPVDAFGAVQASFAVPAGAALGDYTTTIQSGDESATGSFEVQEYRKPEFEVVVMPADRFVVQGGKARVTVTARYYFGQPVARATARYVAHEQGYYSPLRWGDEDDEEGGGGWWGGGEERPGGTVTLDDQGSATLAVPTSVSENERDYSLRIEARVADASGREVTGSAIVHVTFARFLITTELDRYLYAPGSQATLRLRALDYLGVPQPDLPVRVWLETLSRRGRYDEPEAKTVTEASVRTDADGRAVWQVALPKEAGSYRLRASAKEGERDVQAQEYAWVPGGTSFGEMDEGDAYLDLVADKKSYAPGETARFTVTNGKVTAPMLVTKETQEVSFRQVVRSGEGGSFEVPVTEDDVGDTWVNIVFLKDDRLFRAEKKLKVPATARQLQVSITADQAVARPRQPGVFTLKVTDATGRPVQAQLSVGVIDEAVYGVKQETTPDALRFFHRRQYSRVGTSYSREYSFLGFSGTQQLLLARRRRPLTYADFKADKPLQPQVRKEFPDAIFWAGDITTDAGGTARVEVAYPDSLTTWRLTARAVTADTLVGASVARTTTTRDLILRVITPRFLTEGDEVSVPAIVHNYLPDERRVDVTLKADGVRPIEALQPVAMPIPPNGEQRTDWRFKAETPGTATFTGTATTAGDADSVELALPVLPFGLKRQAGAAGSLIGPGEPTAELTLPETANEAGRVVRVSVAPSLAGTLLGALDFLTSYPYGCTEQTLSSFLPNLLVLRALDQVKIAPVERLQSLDRQVSAGLKRLYDYQHEDGGWGWWKTDQNQPFMTAYALYGLLQAQQAGYQVDRERMWQGARELVRLYAKYPRAVPELKAYILYVLTLLANAKPEDGAILREQDFGAGPAFDEAWAARSRTSAYGRAFLLLALEARKDARAAELARELLSAVETKGNLAWWSTESDALLDDWNDTSVEATALIVKGLAERDPKNPVLERAVRWLILNRNYGTYWSSTKQTAMVLYGLLGYMQARGETSAETAVDVYVNGEAIGSRTFTANDLAAADPVVLTAPARTGSNSVRIVKRGDGALYWSATAEYYDKSGRLERTGTRTLALVRSYSALSPVTAKDGQVVYRETPLAGPVRPGDVILVRLSAAGWKDWRYLVIEDPLPAGAEPIPQADGYRLERGGQALPYRWHAERREFRDDRAVFFQDRFDEGRYDFTYLLKVVTPGAFNAMPAQIAPMYVPGSTASSNAQALVVAGPASANAPRTQVTR